MVSPQKLKYNGSEINAFLDPLTVILDVAFDSDSGETSSFLNRSAVASESYDGRYKNTTKYKYDELFSPRFTIVKADFSDFTQSEIRRVFKYLTQTDNPALLEVSYDKDNEQSVKDKRDFCAIGGWTEISMYKIANNRTIGIVATFEAITPYAMSPLYTIPIDVTTNYKATINIDTDDNQPVYPRIIVNHGYNNTSHSVVDIPSTITFSSIIDMVDYVENTVYYNGTTYYWKTSEPVWREATTNPSYEGWTTVQVTRAYTEIDMYEDKTVYHYVDGNMYYWIDPYNFHSSDKNPELKTTSVKITNQPYEASVPVTMIVKNNTTTEKIVLDGANKIISSTNTRRIFGDDFVNWTWLPLYDGKNEITVEGNCEVELSYRTVVKCGEY